MLKDLAHPLTHVLDTLTDIHRRHRQGKSGTRGYPDVRNNFLQMFKHFICVSKKILQSFS